MRRLLAVLLCFSPGCATSLAGGANTAWQSSGGTTQEASFAAGAGLGDGSGALQVSLRGSLGVDLRDGRRTGGFVAGYEFLRYGGEFDSVATGAHYGLYGGVHSTARGDDFVLGLEYGQRFVLHRRGPGGGASGYRLVSLSLAPMVGIAAPLEEERHGVGVQASLGLTVRADDFSSWRFHF